MSLRCHVLVVEDDALFAEALAEVLRADERIEVAARARDGREGVELADALRPDLVLMGIALPLLDGIEATREIRRRHPTVPVIAISGWDYEERALEIREAGAVDFHPQGPARARTWWTRSSLPRRMAAAALDDGGDATLASLGVRTARRRAAPRQFGVRRQLEREDAHCRVGSGRNRGSHPVSSSRVMQRPRAGASDATRP